MIPAIVTPLGLLLTRVASLPAVVTEDRLPSVLGKGVEEYKVELRVSAKSPVRSE